MRLFLHIGAYWLMWSLRSLIPRRSFWRAAQLDTWRLRVIKLAVRVEVLKKAGPPAPAERNTRPSDLCPDAQQDAALNRLSHGRMPPITHLINASAHQLMSPKNGRKMQPAATYGNTSTGQFAIPVMNYPG